MAAFQGADGLIVATSSRAYVYMQLRSPAPIYSAEEFSMSRDSRTRARGNHEWSPPLNARGVQLHNHNHTSTLLLFISLQRRPSTKVGLIRQIRFSILRRNRCHIRFFTIFIQRLFSSNDANRRQIMILKLVPLGACGHFICTRQSMISVVNHAC